MFLGNFSNTLDDKGRVAIPVKFREALAADGEERLVVTRFEVSEVPCLEAYSARAWQDLSAELQSKAGSFSEARLLFETAYIGGGQFLQPDKQGRVLLPQSLRGHAELEQDAVFVGVGKKFRIFSPRGHEKVLEAFRKTRRENPDVFAGLPI